MVKKTRSSLGKGKLAYELTADAEAKVGAFRFEAPGSGPMGQLPLRLYNLLLLHGYDTPSKLRAATDRDLLGIPEIGKTRLAQIRKALRP